MCVSYCCLLKKKPPRARLNGPSCKVCLWLISKADYLFHSKTLPLSSFCCCCSYWCCPCCFLRTSKGKSMSLRQHVRVSNLQRAHHGTWAPSRCLPPSPCQRLCTHAAQQHLYTTQPWRARPCFRGACPSGLVPVTSSNSIIPSPRISFPDFSCRPHEGLPAPKWQRRQREEGQQQQQQ